LLCGSGALALLTAAGPAAAAPHVTAQAGGTCSHQQVSAVNQYCENVPSATGGNQAAPGTEPLSSRLPPSALGRLLGASGRASRAAAGRNGHARSRKAAAASPLLGLPAPSTRLPFSATRHSGANVWSLFPGLLILLAALALGLGAVAFVRRRVSQA
jgi:hypothetical protein